MAGPYSREFGERQAAKLVESGQIEVRADGSVWRLRHVNPNRAHAQRRIDYPGTRTAHRTLRVNVKELLTQSENQLHRFRELGHVPSVTVIRKGYEQVVSAARTAVETGELEGLKKALRAFDAGEARWARKG